MRKRLALRERYFEDYGATVAGLSRHHAMDAHDFLAHVHDVDYSVLDPDPELGALIEQLPGRKIVFTNGGGGHGQRALAQLAIAHCFELVFDIEAAGLAPKPQRAAYERLIAAVRHRSGQERSDRGFRAQSRTGARLGLRHRADRRAKARPTSIMRRPT